MEEQMLFFPLMTDGTLGLVENLYQRSHSKLFLEISVLPSVSVKYLCCTILCHCSGANSITTVATPPHQRSFTAGPTFFRAIKVLKVLAGWLVGSIAGNNIYPEPFVPPDTFQDQGGGGGAGVLMLMYTTAYTGRAFFWWRKFYVFFLMIVLCWHWGCLITLEQE